MSRLLLTEPLQVPKFNSWDMDRDIQTHTRAFLSDIVPIELENFNELHASIVQRGRGYYFDGKDKKRLLITLA